MDKGGARFILNQMALPGELVHTGSRPTNSQEHKHPKMIRRTAESRIRYGVFDLETQRFAQEVGGWHMAHKMRVSCGVVYDSLDDTFAVYMEDQVVQLIEHLRKVDLVVGFNSKRFDYKVLSAYSRFDFEQLNSLDLLEAVHRTLGFRLSLDHLAQQTLNAKKSGSGLDALKWWRQGRIDKIIAYCRKDVEITRDLYRFARDNKYLVYSAKDGKQFRVPMTKMHP